MIRLNHCLHLLEIVPNALLRILLEQARTDEIFLSYICFFFLVLITF